VCRYASALAVPTARSSRCAHVSVGRADVAIFAVEFLESSCSRSQIDPLEQIS
jgi:hypothetical protein